MEEILVLMRNIENSSSEIAAVVMGLLQEKVIPLVGVVIIVWSFVVAYKMWATDARMADLKPKIFGFLARLVLLVWGVTFLGMIDNLFLGLEKAVRETELAAYSAIGKEFQLRADQIEVDGLLNSSYGILAVEAGMYQSMNGSYKKMMQSQADAIEKRLDAVSALGTHRTLSPEEQEKRGNQQLADVFNSLAPKQYVADGEDGESSWWNMDMEEILSEFFTLVAGIAEIVIRTMKIIFLTIFKIAFPLVILISFLPKKEKVIETYCETYMTVQLWTIVIILIELATRVIHTVLSSSIEEPSAKIIFVLVYSVILTISYMMVPNLTVMIFGGNTVTATVMSAVTSTAARTLGINQLMPTIKKAAMKGIAGKKKKKEDGKKEGGAEGENK